MRYFFFVIILICVPKVVASDESDLLNYVAKPTMDLCLQPYTDYMAGENLFLRPVFPDDHLSFRAVFMNPDAMSMLGDGKVKTEKECIEFCIRDITHNDLALYNSRIFTMITSDGVAGRIAIYKRDNDLLELAYFIRPDQGGRGYTTEGSKLVMNYYGGNFEATAHPQNIPSIRVLQKLGFHPDPTRQNVPKYGSVRNYWIYLASE